MPLSPAALSPLTDSSSSLPSTHTPAMGSISTPLHVPCSLPASPPPLGQFCLVPSGPHRVPPSVASVPSPLPWQVPHYPPLRGNDLLLFWLMGTRSDVENGGESTYKNSYMLCVFFPGKADIKGFLFLKKHLQIFCQKSLLVSTYNDCKCSG